MSQTALGEALGVSFQQIQKYERGHNRVGAGALYKMAVALNVPISYFFDGLPALANSDDCQSPRD
jgi:transcriptional regulator with XRE-family HTH domain